MGDRPGDAGDEDELVVVEKGPPETIKYSRVSGQSARAQQGPVACRADLEALSGPRGVICSANYCMNSRGLSSRPCIREFGHCPGR